MHTLTITPQQQPERSEDAPVPAPAVTYALDGGDEHTAGSVDAATAAGVQLAAAHGIPDDDLKVVVRD